MKKLFLIALSAFAVSSMNAQTTNETPTVSKTEYTKNRAEGIEARAQRDVDALDKQLTLTAEQKEKAKAFVVTKINKQTEVRAKYRNREDNDMAEKRKTELTAINEEYKTNIKSILTPSQVEKFNAMP